MGLGLGLIRLGLGFLNRFRVGIMVMLNRVRVRVRLNRVRVAVRLTWGHECAGTTNETVK